MNSMKGKRHLKYSTCRNIGVKDQAPSPCPQTMSQPMASFHCTAAVLQSGLYTLKPRLKALETTPRTGRALHTLMTLYRDYSHQ